MRRAAGFFLVVGAFFLTTATKPQAGIDILHADAKVK
jgi:hypothetical protein